jgi:hypothetical protein
MARNFGLFFELQRSAVRNEDLMRNLAQLQMWVTAILVAMCMSLTSPALAADQCVDSFEPSTSKVVVSINKYQSLLKNLRATLSGKLATVWRSEWKTKLSIEESNSYVHDLAERFLTPETKQFVLAGLDPSQEGYVREVHQRLYELEKQGKLVEKDELTVRDEPPPPGTFDRTFTYYTKPIVTGDGGGKHQLRVRTYMRELIPSEMQVNTPVNGYNMSGVENTITKLADGNFQIVSGTGDNQVVRNVNEFGLKKLFGVRPILIAPHGLKFKMEIKTALRDEISGEDYELLGGDHMVEKLDVGLSWAQVRELFNGEETGGERLNIIKSQLLDENPTQTARINAVFGVLEAGEEVDPTYLTIAGATIYNRTAFESPIGFQTTVDREQAVAQGNMYAENNLKDPSQVIRKNKLIMNGEKDARHVELKVPVTLMNSAVGVEFRDGTAELDLPKQSDIDSVRDAIEIYEPYVKSDEHPGKFNYGLKNKASGD